MGNYWKPTAKKWKRLQTGIKAIFATISGSVYLNHEPKIALWVLVGGMVLNELIEFFAPEEEPQSKYSNMNIDTEKRNEQ